MLKDADMSIDDIFGCEQIRSPTWNRTVRRITGSPSTSSVNKISIGNLSGEEDDIANESLPRYESLESLDVSAKDILSTALSELSTGALSMNQLETSDVFGAAAIANPVAVQAKHGHFFDIELNEELENITEPNLISLDSGSDSLSLLDPEEMATDDLFDQSKIITDADVREMRRAVLPPMEGTSRELAVPGAPTDLLESASMAELAEEINFVLSEFCRYYKG